MEYLVDVKGITASVSPLRNKQEINHSIIEDDFENSVPLQLLWQIMQDSLSRLCVTSWSKILNSCACVVYSFSRGYPCPSKENCVE